MAIAFVQTSSAGGTTGSTSCAMPTGTTQGMTMLAYVAAASTAAINAPAGWTRIGTQQSGSTTMSSTVFYKVAASGETGPYSFTSGAVQCDIVIDTYSGMNAAGAIVTPTSGSTSNTTAGTITIPSMTTVIGNTRFIFLSYLSTSAATVPSGYNRDGTRTTSSPQVSIYRSTATDTATTGAAVGMSTNARNVVYSGYTIDIPPTGSASMGSCSFVAQASMSARFPYQTIPVRYIRDWANGSNVSATGNYWEELSAVDSAGNKFTNFSADLSPAQTAVFGSVSPPSNFNDGDYNTYVQTAFGSGVAEYLMIDLGSIQNVGAINVARYTGGGGGTIFNETKIEVSTDQLTWTTVFDSAVSGTYGEPGLGQYVTFPVPQTSSGGGGTTNYIGNGDMQDAAAMSGDLTTGKALNASGMAISVATMAGQLTTAIRLGAQPAAQATLNPTALTTAIRPKADLFDSASMTGGLTTAITPAANLLDVAAMSGQLTTAIPLAGSMVDAAALTGALTTSIRPAASLLCAAAATGQLTTNIALAAAPAAQASLSADMAVGNVLGTASGVASASITGALTTAIPLAAQPAASASLSAPLVTAIRPAAQPAAQAAMTGQLTTAIPLATQLVASSTIGAPLATSIRPAAQLSAQANATAAITTQIRPKADLAASASITGALTTAIPLKADFACQATITPVLVTTIRMYADAVCVAQVAADLFTISAPMKADMSAQSTMTADMTAQIRVAANLTGSASMSAALTTAIPLSAASADAASMSGQLTTAIRMAAQAIAQAQASAALTTAIPLKAQQVSNSVVTANLTTAIPLAASLSCQASAQAIVVPPAGSYPATSSMFLIE